MLLRIRKKWVKFSVKHDDLFDKIEDLWNKITLPFYHQIVHPYNSHVSGFWRRISNIIRWIPIFWYDHDWDYHYFLKIVHKKIGYMENSIRNGHLEQSEKYADKLKIVKECLNRINKNFHDELQYKELDDKFGKMGDVFNVKATKRVWISGDGLRKCRSYTSLNFQRSKEHEFKEEYVRQRMLELHKYYDDLKQADLRVVLMIFEKDMWSFWD